MGSTAKIFSNYKSLRWLRWRDQISNMPWFSSSSLIDYPVANEWYLHSFNVEMLECLYCFICFYFHAFYICSLTHWTTSLDILKHFFKIKRFRWWKQCYSSTVNITLSLFPFSELPNCCFYIFHYTGSVDDGYFENNLRLRY